MVSCPHQTYTIREEPGQGGTYLVVVCTQCSAELSRTFVPG